MRKGQTKLDWLKLENYTDCKNFTPLDWLKAIAIRAELSCGTAEAPNIPQSISECLQATLKAPCSLNLEPFPYIQREVDETLTQSAVVWQPSDRAPQIYVDLDLPDALLINAVKQAILAGRTEQDHQPYRKQRYRWENFSRDCVLPFLDCLLWSESNQTSFSWEDFIATIDPLGELEESTTRKQCYQAADLLSHSNAFRVFKEQAFQESGKK